MLGYGAAAALSGRAAGHESDLRFGTGVSAGVTINPDQWTLGGHGRLDGVCVFVCARHLGVGVRGLAGIGGNHVTVRAGPSLHYVFWFAEEDTVGLDVGLGGAVMGFIPVGDFAAFCNRVDLDGCGGTFLDAEGGVALRLWPAFVQALVATGELPVLTITAGWHWPIWREKP